MHAWAFQAADEDTQIAMGVTMIVCWVGILLYLGIGWLIKKIKKQSNEL